ncbi:helix-turn-helix domain-containing protein [Skermanella stibiiresistens]|uniref:helix-turn-helix domain-containing protein n=1 Tax=Skermanella stibiiresistens TaxID=913326 RepID=UPI003CCB9EDA
MVETIARVRREHAKGKSVGAIARSLKLSRETVSKYLRSGETAPRYERQVQPYPQLAVFQKDLERLVEENDRQPVRDRLDYLGFFKRLQAACQPTSGWGPSAFPVQRYRAGAPPLQAASRTR